MSMRLLFVIDSLGSGGAQRQMVTLARALHQLGHHVEFFVYHAENFFSEELADSGIPVHLHAKRYRFSLGPVLALRAVLRARSFDIVLAFLDTPSLYAELASLGITGTRIVVSERSMFLPGKMSLRRRALQQMHRFADAITVNSHHQRDRMNARYPWMRQRTHTIYNGYDLNEFRPRPIERTLGHGLRLLVVASISSKKNSLNLAKALKICLDRYGLTVGVDWIGRHDTSGDSRLAFEKTSAYLLSAGIACQWRWLGERRDIPEQLSTFDALVHPSFFEGLSNAICEALCCGRPVLAGRVCDHAHLVQHGIRGLLFDPTSPESIAECICEFDRLNVSTRARMGEEARKFAEEHLSCQRYAKAYEHLFQELLQPSPASL